MDALRSVCGVWIRVIKQLLASSSATSTYIICTTLFQLCIDKEVTKNEQRNVPDITPASKMRGSKILKADPFWWHLLWNELISIKIIEHTFK